MKEKQKLIKKLIAARDLIKDFKNWTTHAFARDKSGEPCEINSKRACSWCAVGALYKVCGKDYNTSIKLDALFYDLSFDNYKNSLMTVNDSHNSKKTHKKVLKIYDKAIEKLKS